MLEALRQLGAPGILTVLKRFGDGNRASLSFPIARWSLAMDVPAAIPGLHEVLNHLDLEVAVAGGRLYLAKDSLQSAAMVARCYAGLGDWQQQQRLLDPKGLMSSSLSRRLELLEPAR